MPRGVDRVFLERVRAAASVLGIDGTDFGFADSVFIEKCRDAYADLGFSVGAAGRSSREFRELLTLANTELGISAFPAQTMSLDFDGVSEALKNTTKQAIGIADTWSIGIWLKATTVVGQRILFEFGDFPADENRIVMIQSGGQMQVFWANAAGTLQSTMVFFTFLSAGPWTHIFLSWNAAGTGPLTVFKNGIGPVAPDSTAFSNVVQADTPLRAVAIGNATTPNVSWSGPIAQVSVWRTVQDAAIADLYNAGNPNSLDLNSGFGSYAGAGDLAHWYRLGHEPSPNLGKDYALAGFTPTIDIEVNAVGITDADRVADVPT